MGGDWESYCNQVTNRFNYDTNDWEITNVCSGAVIYGTDGSEWGKVGEGGPLTTYDFVLEGMGASETVSVNEVTAALGAADGNRNPTRAGIRFGGKKYMLTFKEDEKAIAQLTTVGGGAVVGMAAPSTAVCRQAVTLAARIMAEHVQSNFMSRS